MGDALLDTASSGVNVIEREGHSASHAAEFVLLGSMNPEEGLLRPQLLDRFALAVDIAATFDPAMRQTVIERRIAFERDPSIFQAQWSPMEQQLRDQIIHARNRVHKIVCSNDILAQITASVCDAGVRSLRADLAVVRASIAYAALAADETVTTEHVSTVLPLVLAHRSSNHRRPPAPRTEPPASHPAPEQQSKTPDEGGQSNVGDALTRIFTPKEVQTFALRPSFDDPSSRGASARTLTPQPGPVVGARRTEAPREVDIRATLNHAVMETGNIQPKVSDLHERIRTPAIGTRYLLVIDSSGSHAPQERMRLVKGAASNLLTRSFKNGDEIVIIVFRGTSAQVLLEPSRSLNEATTVLEYLPTGGRTPLAHALDLARTYLTPTTVLILLTDGRANVPIGTGDPWQEVLEIAAQIRTPSLVIDTENTTERLERSRQLAEVLCAEYVRLESPELSNAVVLASLKPPVGAKR